jgi:class 3 adenylate cyclase/TolB-like protein
MPESIHQLAAILFSDIVGYTAIMSKDVEFGLELLRKNREIQKPTIEKYNGKFLKEMGDGILAQFNSAIDAIHCALEIQKKARTEMNAKIRIGIHLGDVTIENEDVFGDGVNIASRLQSIADPGGIYISESIFEAIRARKDIQCDILGDVQLKNVDHPVKTYFVIDHDLPIPSARKRKELTGIRRKPLYKQIWFYITLIALIIVTSLAVKWISDSQRVSIRSIAVLPVENLSGNEDEEWLVSGVHSGLIDEMTKIKKLRIVPRRSTLKYKSTDKSVPEIATELDVEGIVEVSIIRTSNNVNIQVRLIQAFPEDKQLWKQTYNREMQNILTAYSGVARDIAQVINISLSPDEDFLLAGTHDVNPVAYEAYLRGMLYFGKLDNISLDKALQHFELARDIDPDYPQAYYGIAICWGGKMQGGFLPYSVAGPNLKAALDKALSLDSTLIDAHLYQAVSNTWFFWNWDKAEKEFQTTLNMIPNYVNALAGYAHYLAIMGYPEEALPYAERAYKIEKMNGLIHGFYGMALGYVHRYDDAIRILEEAALQFPDEMIIFYTLRTVYHEKKMYAEAIEAGKKYYQISNDSVCIKALEEGFREGGYQFAMQRNAEARIEQSKTKYITPYQIATLYVRAGMNEESLDWLEKGYEEHDANMPYIAADPLFDHLREDPRFKDLCQRMNLPHAAVVE